MSRDAEYESAVQALLEDIKVMFLRDQEMRQRAAANQGVIETQADDTIDTANTERLKEIARQIGWPIVSKVGADVAHMAWLLVQHADHDVEWQKQCLTLMKEQTPGEVSPEDIAYLEDRVRVNEGRPQLYGTQFFDEGVNYRPQPIEDPERVDEWRAARGMESLAEYTRQLKEKHNEK